MLSPFFINFDDDNICAHNGVWQDIDNTLYDLGNEVGTSDSRVKFAKKITGNEVLFTLHENNHKLTMSLDGAIKIRISTAAIYGLSYGLGRVNWGF